MSCVVWGVGEGGAGGGGGVPRGAGLMMRGLRRGRGGGRGELLESDDSFNSRSYVSR